MSGFKVLAAAVGMTVCAAVADAATIAPGSQINFAGAGVALVKPDGAGGYVATNLNDPAATGIDFGSGPGTSFTPGSIGVPIYAFGGNGDFAGVFGFLTPGMIYDFSFNPASMPVTPLFTIGGPGTPITSLNLTSITSYGYTAGGFAVSGDGVLFLTTATTAYDPTPGAFSFSTQDSAGGTVDYTLSFSVNASAIPEPATIALFGTALLGLGFAGCARHKEG